MRISRLAALGVAAALHENVEYETILMNSAPESVFLATDRNDDFVEVPFVAESTNRTPANVVCKVPTEFLYQSLTVWCVTTIPGAASMSSPLLRLRGKPNSVGDQLSGKTTAAVERITKMESQATSSQTKVDRASVTGILSFRE